ncbi:unnamed protein product [Kuraishia capsulata CBS 1993]|uniref:Nucleotide exchange factor SIL1 n=1 Tax=Kuraishia capsulata CBS 1993 TaxID=1382522 RepID=W6MS54_9ASCO|nr:uncharacterized protein KUCA_T00005614001 [Kuraishia capsulata CBS 1993]CDK29621.1 unnamed protein product [Kuraishia capsulata CBS 1993]
MKIGIQAKALLLASFLCLVFALEDPSLVCPDDNPENCYPLEFEPTTEWQEIRSGQRLPPGLHVRLDMSTGVQQAKLVDPSEGEEGKNDDVIAVVVEESPATEQPARDTSFKENARIPNHERDEFSVAMETVSEAVSGKEVGESVLIENLEALSHLAHEYDFGVKLSRDMEPLLKLTGLTSGNSDWDVFQVREPALRVIAASLRNNGVAQATLLGDTVSTKNTALVQKLLQTITTEKDAILQKRLLGVLSAILQDQVGVQVFNEISGTDQLLSTYPLIALHAQPRVVQILEDLEADGEKAEDHEKREYPEDDFVPRLLQKRLLQTKADDATGKSLLEALVLLKNKNTGLKASSELLNWLSSEAKRVANKDYSARLVEIRHRVFGNPMGMRKAFADEL